MVMTKVAQHRPGSADGDGEGQAEEFRQDLLKCFGDEQATLPARWLYDARGSDLFEKITELPEYYPTRTEIALLRRHAADIAAKVGAGRMLVEFGSGSSTKTPLLIEAMRPALYVPIDVSGSMLQQAVETISEMFPELSIAPLEADFSEPITLPHGKVRYPALGFFPGSTIGNLTPYEATDLLRRMRQTLGKGAKLLIGMDQRKSDAVLIPAYDDAQGVTAEFNLNVLRRANRELGADIPVDRFRHEARWNDGCSRVEMHLVAREDVEFELGDESVSLEKGSTLHTENSHKYGRHDSTLLLRAGGWDPVQQWSDEKEYFAVILAEAL